jgi:hypothetical protein
VTTCGTLQFGGEANWTVVEVLGNGNLGDAMGGAMKVARPTKVEMAKALMPKETKLVASQVTDLIYGRSKNTLSESGLVARNGGSLGDAIMVVVGGSRGCGASGA